MRTYKAVVLRVERKSPSCWVVLHWLRGFDGSVLPVASVYEITAHTMLKRRSIQDEGTMNIAEGRIEQGVCLVIKSCCRDRDIVGVFARVLDRENDVDRVSVGCESADRARHFDIVVS